MDGRENQDEQDNSDNGNANNTEDIVSVKRRVEAQLLGLPGVTGVDVGYKYVGGERTNEIAIRVHVAEKKARVPKAEMVPPVIDGVKTDVIERKFVLQPLAVRVEDVVVMSDTGRYDPLRGGISIGPCRTINGFVYSGTLGALVKDNGTGETLMLSNFHVMCVDSAGKIGDSQAQPSRGDTGTCPADMAGAVRRFVLSSHVDGAVASISSRGHAPSIVDIGNVTGSGIATLGMPVRKRGRTTGLTYGTVDSIDLTVSLDYGDGIGPKTLIQQIGIEVDKTQSTQIGNSGDSGSVVVDNQRRVVGLYFAGTEDGTFGVANPIAFVLEELNVSLLVGSTKSVLKDAVDNKHGKREWKDLKLEKVEIKEYWHEKSFFDKSPKELVENPNMPDPVGPIENRLANIENTVAALSHFIGTDLRPDLTMGALRNESDEDHPNR